MKKIFAAILLLTGAGILADAQNNTGGSNFKVPEGYELVDSLVYTSYSSSDESLAGKNVFSIMPTKRSGSKGEVTVHQSQTVANAMSEHIRKNSDRSLAGYRVRIYFDNKQNSRGASEAALNAFESRHHDVAAYRTYANPYFKVTVGDFRTKSEAMKLLQSIRGEFPSAMVVKENIQYPVVDRFNAYKVDTIKVLRPKKVSL